MHRTKFGSIALIYFYIKINCSFFGNQFQFTASSISARLTFLREKKTTKTAETYRYFCNKEMRYTYICQDTSSQYNKGTLKSQNNWFNLYTWSILGWKCSVGPNLFNNFFTNFIITVIHGRSSCGHDRHWRSSDEHSPPTSFSQTSVPTKKPRRLTSISQGSPAGVGQLACRQPTWSEIRWRQGTLG